MNILFIAPLPPPITGHALASQVFLDELRQTHNVEAVNLSVGTRHDGTVTVRRLLEVAKVLVDVWRRQRRTGAIYLTISESVAGNLKDVLIYQLCAARLSRMYIHLHGGSIGKLLFDRHPLLRRINARFIDDLAGVIVSGASHVDIFAGMIDRARIHIVPNFAQDHLFVTEQTVVEKFAATEPLRVLYMSGMTRMKGYHELADAYLGLPGALKPKIRVDFAGKFESQAERAALLDKLSGVEGIRYHGVVDEAQKQRLFASAHVFCLPTAFREGQPIALLEAYASGCVVLTTGQAGIRDVFTPGINGFEVEEESAASVRAALEAVASNASRLLPMALANRRTADSRYRRASYNTALRRIVEA